MSDNTSPLRLTCYLAAAALIIISPNLFVFSTDDLFVYTKSSLTGRFASGQAADGRYTFALLCYLMQFIGFSNSSYLVVSTSSFALSLSVFYMSIVRILGLVNVRQIWCGFLLFVTFGLTLDLYQFVFAGLAYAIGFLCTAAIVYIVADAHRSPIKKVILSSLAMFIALGSYQIASITLTMVFLSASVVAVGRGQRISEVIKPAVPAMLSIIIGSLLYLIFNSVMHLEGVSSFANYPRRDQSLSYIVGNIPRYIETLRQLSQWTEGQYEPLLPSIWHLLFTLIIIYLVLARSLLEIATSLFQLLIVLLTVLIIPNPLNLLLKVYWPSARSFSSFGVFVGVVSASLVSNDKKCSNFIFNNVKCYVIYALIISQIVVSIQRYRDRLDQKEADFSLAQTILANVYELYSVNEPIHLEIGVRSLSIGTLAPKVFDFGRSYFATPWSAPALFEYLSGDRVTASNAPQEDCKPDYPRLYIKKESNRALVCITL